MKNVNQVTLFGRLGADPVQRETKSGVRVAHFPVATSRRTKVNPEAGGEGAEYNTETEWHRVVVWGKEAELCSRYLHKGQPVFIQGMIRSHKFEGKDGVERLAFEIHADDVCFFNRWNGPQAVPDPVEPVENGTPTLGAAV